MTWEFKDSTPIYSQLIEQIQLQILSGIYSPGEKIPSVREMASIASVNPNTMQKALTELEKKGLLYTQRTAGRFITGDIKMIQNLQRELAKEQIENFFINMEAIGFTKEETIKLINDR